MATSTNPSLLWNPPATVNPPTSTEPSLWNPPPPVNRPTSTEPSKLSNPPTSGNPPAPKQPSPEEVLTTIPLLGFDGLLKPITSERLILRPLKLSDLFAYHSLKSQAEATAFGIAGGSHPDSDLNQTFLHFSHDLNPWESGQAYGIFLKKPEGKEGSFIGKFSVGSFIWPEIDYMLKREFWGQGFGTEVVKAFTHFWWNLPRVQKRHFHPDPDALVDNTQIYSNSPPQALEFLKTRIELDNIPSHKVMDKAGFKKYGEGEQWGIKYIKYRQLRPQSWFKTIREEIKEGKGKIRKDR
jgi:RimJ/RimL family protein N-acetyltransferase